MKYSLILLAVYYSINLIFIVYFNIYKKNFNLKRYVFIQVVVHALFLGLRDINVGTDTIRVYYPVYMEKHDWLEIGFVYLNKIIRGMGVSFNIYIFIIALITCVNFGIAYYVMTDKKDTNIAIWGFFGTSAGVFLIINALRQGLAASIFLVSLAVFSSDNSKKRKVVGVLLFFLAVSFHKSVIVLFPIFFIIEFKIKDKILIYLIALGLLLTFTGINQMLVQYIPIDFIKNKLISYRGTYENNNLNYKIILHVINVIFLMILTKKNKLNKWLTVLKKAYIYMLIISVFSAISSETSKRFMWYMSTIIPLIYVNSIEVLKEKKYFKYIVIVFLFTYMIVILNHPSIKINFNF